MVVRRGQGFSEHFRGLKTPLLEALEAGEGGESASDRRVRSWSLWGLTRDLPSRKGASRKDSRRPPETTGLESPGTIGSAERSPDEGGPSGGKTFSPGSGPLTQREWQSEDSKLRILVPGRSCFRFPQVIRFDSLILVHGKSAFRISPLLLLPLQVITGASFQKVPIVIHPESPCRLSSSNASSRSPRFRPKSIFGFVAFNTGGTRYSSPQLNLRG